MKKRNQNSNQFFKATFRSAEDNPFLSFQATTITKIFKIIRKARNGMFLFLLLIGRNSRRLCVWVAVECINQRRGVTLSSWSGMEGRQTTRRSRFPARPLHQRREFRQLNPSWLLLGVGVTQCLPPRRHRPFCGHLVLLPAFQSSGLCRDTIRRCPGAFARM